MKRSSAMTALKYGVVAAVVLDGAIRRIRRRPPARDVIAPSAAAALPVGGGPGEPTPPAPVASGDHVTWQGSTWEPYKIAMGAFYALCLQKAFDAVIAFFQKNPVRLSEVTDRIVLTPAQQITILQLGAYVIWVSIYFLHNGRMYFRLDPEPARRRIFAHGILTVGFAVFYFFGATLGQPGRLQLLLICAIIVTDIAFPLTLKGVTRRRARALWAIRSSVELIFVAALFARLGDAQLRTVGWAALLFALMVIQLALIGPLEVRFQLGPATRLARWRRSRRQVHRPKG